MKTGSLCSGYGGLDMAVGGDLQWVCDFDEGAAKILAHRYPDIPNLHDLTAIDWTEVEPVDVITAGYPCQPFSNAGKRAGTSDARHIWPHIADAIRALRPRYAVFENVAGHVSLGLTDVLADLAEIGFDAQWGTVRASDVGAPHRRERLFILATNADVVTGKLKPIDGERRRTGKESTRPARLGNRAHATTDTGRGRRGEDHPRRRDMEQVGDAGIQAGWDEDASRVVGDFAATPDTAGDGRQQGRPESAGLIGRPYVAVSGDTTADIDLPAWGDYGPAIARWERVLGRPAPNPTTTGRTGKPVLNPPFVEWMMGLPAGWVTGHGLSAAKELKMLGNGVCPQQAHAAISALMERTCQS